MMIRKGWRKIAIEVVVDVATATAVFFIVNNLMSAVDDPIEELVAILTDDVYFIARRVCESAHGNFRNRLLFVIVADVLQPRSCSSVFHDKSRDKEASLEYL